MITQRTLLKWRGEALLEVHPVNAAPDSFESARRLYKANQTILRLTQEVLDQQLLKKAKESSDV